MATEEELRTQLSAITAERDALVPWLSRCSVLVDLLLRRRFAAGVFENMDEVAWQALLVECREAAAFDARVEANDLRQALAAKDAVFAAEQRLRAKGATDEDIAALKQR